MIGDGELQREARRILRRLTGGGVLMRQRDRAFAIVIGGKPDRARTCVEPDVVAGFRTRDWIVPRGTVPESFTLSETGAAWLRRTLADGDPFAAQHQLRTRRVVIDGRGKEHDVVVNDAESLLTRLKARSLIDVAQCEAGERLRRDFTLAQLAPRLAADLAAPVVSGRRGSKAAMDMPETVLAAKQRFDRAMKAAGPGLSDLLLDVCCHLIGLEDAERAFGWPSRAGRVVLVIALDRLVIHYGLKMSGPRSAPIRSWQAE